jgi:hypothetical protein
MLNSTNYSTTKMRTYLVKKKINPNRNDGTTTSNASSNIVSSHIDNLYSL